MLVGFHEAGDEVVPEWLLPVVYCLWAHCFSLCLISLTFSEEVVLGQLLVGVLVNEGDEAKNDSFFCYIFIYI